MQPNSGANKTCLQILAGVQCLLHFWTNKLLAWLTVEFITTAGRSDIVPHAF